MLEGSSIEASGCAGENPVQLDIVYGEESFHSCFGPITQPKINSHHGDSHDRKSSLSSSSSSSSSSEEEEEDEDSSWFSSSEEELNEHRDVTGYERGKRSMEHPEHAERARVSGACADSLFSKEITVASEKSDLREPTCPSSFATSVQARRPGTYYVVTRGSGDTRNALNHVLLHVRLNRSGYELPDNMILCRSQNSCEIPLNFGSSEKVVVYVSAEPDAGSVSFPIRSKCKPRLFFYLCVFLAFPLTFAVGLTLAIRQARRRRGGNATSTSVSGGLTTIGSDTNHHAPLLEAAAFISVTNDEAINKHNFNPPPYALLVNDISNPSNLGSNRSNQSNTMEELPPPSYERAVATELAVDQNQNRMNQQQQIVH